MRLRFCSTRGKPGWWEDESGNEVELVSNCITDVQVDDANENHYFVVIIRRTGTGPDLLDELVIGNDTKVEHDWDVNADVNNGEHRVIDGVTINVTQFISMGHDSVLKSWWDNKDKVN
jgi:hypothetical protein